ncbi:MAG: hypothetical protein JW795_03185 [Chitinivibrionales bacterium]|nr:hypothetical protein [Chitinivibrionales bacterium]
MLPYTCLIAFIIGIFSSIYSQSTLSITDAPAVQGISALYLTAPVTADIKAAQTFISRDTLVSEIILWINKNSSYEVDKKNPVLRCQLHNFLKNNPGFVSEKSYFKGHVYYVEEAISDEKTLGLMTQQYRAYVSDQILKNWNLFTNPQTAGEQKLKAGLAALLYSTSRISESGAADASQKNLQHERIRAALQDFLKSVTIEFNNPVVAGKSSKNPVQPLIVTVHIDTAAAVNFPLAIVLGDGTRLANATTGTDGSATLADLKMPFVAFGEVFYVQYDISALVPFQNCAFAITDLGLLSSDPINQSILFKPQKQTYHLIYKISSVNNQIAIPPEYVKPHFIQKFLADSCSLVAADSGKKADFDITVTCQISNYTFDELEQTRVKLDALVSVTERSASAGTIQNGTTILERQYNYNEAISYALFFWESYAKLKKFVRNSLNKL